MWESRKDPDIQGLEGALEFQERMNLVALDRLSSPAIERLIREVLPVETGMVETALQEGLINASHLSGCLSHPVCVIAMSSILPQLYVPEAESEEWECEVIGRYCERAADLLLSHFEGVPEDQRNIMQRLTLTRDYGLLIAGFEAGVLSKYDMCDSLESLVAYQNAIRRMDLKELDA